jgi:DDE superfamily endonuclease
VFIDETWATTTMARRHGRARRGQRLVAAVPHGHWKTTTFLAALRHDRISAPCVFDGAINGERFRAWVEQALAPTLAPGDLVIMDNLGAHKVQGVRDAIEARGASRPGNATIRSLASVPIWKSSSAVPRMVAIVRFSDRARFLTNGYLRPICRHMPSCRSTWP